MLNSVCHYGRIARISLPYAEAIGVVKERLKEEGFGVLCEIDVAKTLKEKLGKDVEPQIILGACNPALAHAALGEEPNLGLLLPCNVVVRESGGTTLVSAIDPHKMLQVAQNKALEPIAEDAAARLDRMLDRLS